MTNTNQTPNFQTTFSKFDKGEIKDTAMTHGTDRVTFSADGTIIFTRFYFYTFGMTTEKMFAILSNLITGLTLIDSKDVYGSKQSKFVLYCKIDTNKF